MSGTVTGGTVAPLAAVPKENGSKSKRRRYFANGRSRTIELSTLAEIDEEEFAKAEGASSQPEGAERVLKTQDDMCIGTTGGTYKSLKRGSVKAQALKLSERLAQKVASENAAKEREEKSEMEKQSCSKPVVVDVKLRRNLTEVRRNFETTTDFTTPQDWPQQQHEYQQNIHMQRHPISRSASFVTPAPMIVYGMPPQPGERMSMIDSRCDSRIGEYAMPLYYMPAPPPPQPVFLPYAASKMGMSHFDQPSMVMIPGHPALQYPEMRRKMKSSGSDHRRKSWCSRICCAGFAQLLWTIVCIISFGIIASLILALCYM
ncbi:unnamed protein product [Caenorhabditis sp. 36 PRJEB53466]|nr:unnamed protein product [Caenorhabditis sp. 36 PRJEB53466]